MNLDPKNELASEQVWSDPALIQSYLNQAYNNTGVGYGDPMPTPGVVDEAVNTHNHPGDVNVQSTLSPGNRGIWDSPGWRPSTNPPYQQYNWSEVYGTIRDLNILISNASESEELSTEDQETLLGEAYFLRAYYYHNLMKLYGGVPVIEEPFELGDDVEQYQVPRNTFAETVDFIVEDLDRAADQLSTEARRPGAASQGAALALQSRVLLFAASDLVHDQSWIGSGDAALVTYTSGSQSDRWEEARDAAQAVIDLGEYSLEQTSSSDEYQSLLVEGGGSGAIWLRFFNEEGGWQHNHSQWVSPNGYNSWSGDTPTQQHVDAYEMSDGSEFEWQGGDPESAEDPIEVDENPYEDRDPRFYANILYNGRDYRARPPGPAGDDPAGVIQTGDYETPGGEGNMQAGLDTRDSPFQNWNGSRTGYNLNKFVDRTILPDREQAYNPWIHIRYAEVVLNYAEAQYQATGSATSSDGGGMSAQEALNMVRSRVGMPDVPANGGPNRTFMERIQQEREVELAFEGHRYFDVRRWMMGEEAYQNAQAIDIVGDLEAGAPEGLSVGELILEGHYNFRYSVRTEQERAWQDKNYFLPIPQAEMERNDQLVQTPNY